MATKDEGGDGMKKVILLVMSLCCFSVGYSAPLSDNPNFVAVEKMLMQNTDVSGKFTQSRQMQGLERPLLSSGTFVLSQSQGLVWKQEKPFASTLTVTQNRLEQQIMDHPPTVITKEQQPIVFGFTQVFMSVLQGNTQAVEQYFNLNFSGSPQAWELVLTPKGSPLDKAIEAITLNGSKTIDFIEVKDAQGNVMEITLSDVVVH